MECPRCQNDVIKDSYRFICSACGLETGTLDTITFVDKQSAADDCDFYTMMMEFSIHTGYTDKTKTLAMDLYHTAKERAEHYSGIAGDTPSSGKWRLENFVEKDSQ